MMIINDQIKDGKLEYDINREAAKISALSSEKLHKYEYLTGEDILPSAQQQIIEQTKLPYSRLGKFFDKQIKTIEDQGKKQVDALEKLKPKEEKKAIEDKPNNQSKAATIFNELINKRNELMNKLYDSADYNNLKFEYVSRAKDVSFYEYKDSKELFKAIRNNQIGFSEVKNKPTDFLNKLTNIKIGRKTPEQEKTINNLERFYLSRQEIISFFRDFTEMLSDANYKAKKNETKGTRFKVLTPKQRLQRLPIALAQVKAGNNSENLLNEISIHCISQKKLLKRYITI